MVIWLFCDREDRVGAPLHLVGRPAARRGAAAPLVGEQHLRAVVAERRRVPEREVRVGDGGDALRVRRIADVEQQAVAAARAAGVADRRIDGDVVALRRSLANPRATAAARATAGGAAWSGPTTATRRTIGVLDAVLRRARGVDRRRGEILEDARLADARGLLRMRHRHLDHFDAELRRVRIVLRREIGASAELTLRAHARRARDVDVDVRPDRRAARARCACASRGRSARP